MSTSTAPPAASRWACSGPTRTSRALAAASIWSMVIAALVM